MPGKLNLKVGEGGVVGDLNGQFTSLNEEVEKRKVDNKEVLISSFHIIVYRIEREMKKNIRLLC